MQFFLDSANLNDIKTAAQLGLIDGVTTNPSLVAKEQKTVSHEQLIREICQLIPGPISAEVIATDLEGMKAEGLKLAKIHPNVVVKLPMTPQGLMAAQFFAQQQIKTNVTLVFSVNQALLAAKAKATYVSPFIGRLDDFGVSGLNLIQEIKQVYLNYGFETLILAASIRHTDHVRSCALAGADVATMPLKVIEQLYRHPQTDLGLEQFLKDHRSSL